MQLDIYTENGAVNVSVGHGDERNYSAYIHQGTGMMDDSEAIFVFGGGSVFYIHGLTPDSNYYGASIWKYIPDHPRRKFELLVEQHKLDIVRVDGPDGIYDVALTAHTSKLPQGTVLA